MATNFTFSEATMKMKASKIRELMKYASMPGIISLAGGMPDPENFPFDDVKTIINNWDKSKIINAMQYGPTPGFPPLLEKLKERMKELRKIDFNNNDLTITTGGQQAIFLISKIFVDPDDIIIVEEPSFIGAIAAFLSNEAKLVSVTLENDGINISQLEELIKKLKREGKKVKYFYTIPNFQNPAGTTTSQEKRKRIYELSLKYDLTILEDDPYGDLYFTDRPEDYLPIKSIGNEAHIIYMSSFSKILCPGFWLGWVVADKTVIEKVQLAKQSVDACSSSFGQVVAFDYLNNNLIDKYLAKMRTIYKNKKNLMIESIKKFVPEVVKTTNPDGGFFLYLTLPDNLDAESVFKKAILEKVAVITGEPFHVNAEDAEKHIRLSFSNSSDYEISKGIEIVGKSIKELLK
jgi:2-aminoadipate transaminase